MSRLHTAFCDLVGCRWPLVQTGMGWVSGARLTAATCEAGGLGILAAATLSTEALDAADYQGLRLDPIGTFKDIPAFIAGSLRKVAAAPAL